MASLLVRDKAGLSSVSQITVQKGGHNVPSWGVIGPVETGLRAGSAAGEGPPAG